VSHLGAKSSQEAAQKLAAEKKKERAEKYPMCEKLTSVRSDKAIIDCFLEWLEENKITLCEPGTDLGEEFTPLRKTSDKLLMEYFGIDAAQLEKERRKILAAQRKANGDTEAGDDD
jgi:hypothetical protein